MPIRILTGRAHANRARATYREIERAAGSASSILLIVPEQQTVQAEIDISEMLSLPGFWNIEILSPSRLRDRVLQEAGGAARVMIDDRGRHMALRAVLEGCEEELTLYRGAGRRAGFVESLSDFLSECKNCGVSPDALASVRDSLPAGLLRTKMADISMVYARYSEALSGRFLDDEDATEALNRGTATSAFLRDAVVFFDGFDVCPPQLCRTIVSIAAACRELTITALLDDDPRGGTLFAPVRMSMGRIVDMARERGIDVRWVPIEAPDAGHAPEIAHLEREYDHMPPAVYGSEAPAISFHTAAHPYAEVERAAARIAELAREGLRYREMAVVCDMGRYGALCRRVFPRHGIPFYQDERHSMALHPLVQLLLSALDAVRLGFRREDVIACLKTGFLPVDEEAVEALENHVLEYPARGARWFRPFERARGDLDELNDWRELAIDPLRRLSIAQAAAKTVRERTRALWAFLEDIGAHQRMLDLVSRWRELGRAEDADTAARVWQLVLECFDQLVDLSGDARLSLRDYTRVLESGWMATSAGILPPSGDAVPIGDPARLKMAEDTKAVFVLGLNDGVLPAGGSDAGLIAGEERRRAARASGLYLGADDRERQDVQTLMLYSALCAPRQHLYLSLAAMGPSGDALRPSLLWNRLRRMFPLARVRTYLREPPLAREWLSTPSGADYALGMALRNHADGMEIDPDWWPAWRALHDRVPQRLERLRFGLSHRVGSPPLPEDLRALLLPGRTSVTRLERFAACPFLYFVRYGLRPAPRPERSLDAPDAGNMLHRSLDRFARAVGASGRSLAEWTQADVLGAFEPLLREELSAGRENLMEASGRLRGMARSIQRSGARSAWTLMRQWQASRFRTLGEEVPFGAGGELPGLQLSFAGGKLVIEGRIDRLEHATVDGREHIRVIDYKSGVALFELDRLYWGLNLQLAVYLSVALAARPDARPAGMFLYKIGDPIVRTDTRDPKEVMEALAKETRLRGLALSDVDVVRAMGGEMPHLYLPVKLKKDGDISASASRAASGEDFQAILRHAQSQAAHIGQRIACGETDISPYMHRHLTPCQYCEAAGICGFEAALGGRYRWLESLNAGAALQRIWQESGAKGGSDHAQMDR